MKSLKNLERKSLIIVIMTVFLDVLGVGILIPVLPQLIYKIFLPAGYSQNGSLIMLGWLVGIYPLMQFVATPILGQLSDRYGRKPVLAFSLAGTALGYVLFAYAIVTKNIPLLFISRGFDGVTGGNLSVARAVIADVSPPEHRTRNFALIGACFGMGFVMGPYLGARLATPGINFFGIGQTPSWFTTATPFWFTAALSLLNTILMLAILPETHQHINKALKITWTKALDNIRRAAVSPSLKHVFAAEFFFWGGFSFFQTFFQVYLVQKLGFKTNNIGDLFAYIGIWIAITQATVTPFLAKRFKNYQVLRLALFMNGLALFLQLTAHSSKQLLITAPFIAVFNGLVIANSSALISLSADKSIQGEVLGIEASVQALAQAIPSIMSGYIATMGINMPVIVGGSTIIVGALIFNFWYRPPKNLQQGGGAPAMGMGH